MLAADDVLALADDLARCLGALIDAVENQWDVGSRCEDERAVLDRYWTARARSISHA